MLFGGLYRDANFTGIKEVFINYNSGWAEATKTLTHLIKASIALRVLYRVATIETLLFDHQGNCIGVQTSSGKMLTTTHIILAAGAAISKLLSDSTPR